MLFEELIIAIFVHWQEKMHVYKQKWITKAIYKYQEYLEEIL